MDEITQEKNESSIKWMRAWRFDILFLTLTKLGFVGTIVSLMDSRGHSLSVEFYNLVFVELYTIMIAAKAKKGAMDVSWIIAFSVIQFVCTLLSYVPCHLSFLSSCWSIEDCTKEHGGKIIDLAIFILASLISVTYLVSTASGIFVIIFLSKGMKNGDKSK